MIVGLPLPKEMSKSKSLLYNELKARNVEPDFDTYAIRWINQVERQQAILIFCDGDVLLLFLVVKVKYPYLLFLKGKRMLNKYFRSQLDIYRLFVTSRAKSESTICSRRRSFIKPTWRRI